jgi:hypothetical protein
MRIMRKLTLAFTLSALLAAAPLSAADAPDSFPATVTDISDRAYRPAVMQLLDNAKRSIVISMYAVSLGPEGNNPMKFMIDRLFAARERGVSVTLYLNTCFRSTERSPRNLIENPLLDKLKDAGCTVILLPTNRKVHDKLIIVDSAYIVEGSTNWSLSGLMSNYESDTLTHSPDLAAVKLLRLANLPTADSHDNPPPKRIPSTLYLESLPAELVIPAAFIEDRKYFASMLRHVDNQCISFYFLLLAHSQKTGQKDFYVDLESMGVSLGYSEDAGNVGLRRQVIGALRNLANRYELIQVKFFHDKDAAVKLIDMPGKTFTVTTRDLGLSPEQPLSARIRFLVLAKAYLASNGEDIDSMSDYALTKRFGVTHCTVGDARRDIGK